MGGNGAASGGPGGTGAPGGEGGTINNYYGPTSSRAGSLTDPDVVFKEAPDAFPMITLGCTHIMPDGSMLPSMASGTHEPFVQILGPAKQQYGSPIKLYIAKGTLFADVDLYSPRMGTGFVLRGNAFTVANPDWDENHNDWAIEVVNEIGVPIFQLIRHSRSDLRVNGLFELFDVAVAYTPTAFGRVEFVSGNYEPNKDFLLPMFKHPGREYRG